MHSGRCWRAKETAVVPSIGKVLEFTKTMLLLKERIENLEKHTEKLAAAVEAHERRLIHVETFLQVATDGRYLPPRS